MKRCSTCKQEKPESAFYFRKDTGRLRSNCKDCFNAKTKERYHSKPEVKEAHNKASRRHYLKKLYGLSVTDYELMLEAQEHRCAICGEPEKQQRTLAVDHDHRTGKVRALLCQSCNTAIGKLKDDPDLMRRAAKYVESHSSERA